jgi:hypothetical protein
MFEHRYYCGCTFPCYLLNYLYLCLSWERGRPPVLYRRSMWDSLVLDITGSMGYPAPTALSRTCWMSFLGLGALVYDSCTTRGPLKSHVTITRRGGVELTKNLPDNVFAASIAFSTEGNDTRACPRSLPVSDFTPTQSTGWRCWNIRRMSAERAAYGNPETRTRNKLDMLIEGIEKSTHQGGCLLYIHLHLSMQSLFSRTRAWPANKRPLRPSTCHYESLWGM